MVLRFTVLASGSGGNASVVETDGFTVLLDAGLGPRQLAARLAAANLSWAEMDAVILTHTHTDHWNERTFAHLHKMQRPLYCHPGHELWLMNSSPAFGSLRASGLVRPFEPWQTVEFAAGLRCRPLPVKHDGGPTFGFRFEGTPDLFGKAPALAYTADLGTWDAELADALTDVDLLAVEFNHDEELERRSGRSPHLIARVLGDAGHLSNCQAASLVGRVLTRTPAGRLRHLVQLHLSRECNRPALARAAAEAALADHDGVDVHTAEQDVVGQTLVVGGHGGKVRRKEPRQRRSSRETAGQPLLPGFAD